MGDIDGYNIFFDEMSNAIGAQLENMDEDEKEELIRSMWNSIDALQRKIYEEKAEKSKFLLNLHF